MKMEKKGLCWFTLVELIVVITILAILWTIGFISLNGYNNDANNSKVINDLRSLWWAMEVARTGELLLLDDFVINDSTNNEVNSNSIINNSWSVISDWNVMYKVWNISFAKLKQNGSSFKDPNSFDKKQDYIFAIVKGPWFSYYQFWWQLIENDAKFAKLNGNYTQLDINQDAISLISSRADDQPIENRKPITWDLYQN